MTADRLRGTGSPSEAAPVRVPEQGRGSEPPGEVTAPEGTTSVTAPATLPAASPPADPPTRHRRIRLRTVLSPLVSIAIVVGVFWFFLPQFTSISAIGHSIRSMSPLAVAGLLVAASWNLATYWLVMVATMPGLRYREAAVVTEAATAVSNTLPGGGAIGIAMCYQMYSSWGFSRARASVSLVVAGIFNNFAKLALPILALTLLALSGSPSGGRVIAGLIGVGALVAATVVLGWMLHSEAFCARIGIVSQGVATTLLRPFGKPPATGWDRATLKFRDRTVLLLRARWAWIAGATLISHLSLFGVLLTTLHAVGVSQAEVGWIEALAVYSFARLVTAIPLTPGGLGVVELALITGLAGAGGPRAEVAAAVLIFRALTYVVPIPLGLGCYLFWKRNTSWRRPPNSAPRTALVPETTPIPGSSRDGRSEASPTESARPAVDVGTATADRLTIESDSSPGSEPGLSDRIGWSHPRIYGVSALVALVLLALTVIPIDAASVPDPEETVFRWVNNRAFVPFVLVWPFMQLGNFLVLPVAGLIAALTRRFRLCATILGGGVLVWLLAKGVKRVIERGRPFTLLPDVHLHGTISLGLGYPSGHAAVAAVIATVCWPYLHRRWRLVAAALVLTVCLARMWVGAHLPLDVVAGSALGVVIGSVLVLIAGRPLAPSPSGHLQKPEQSQPPEQSRAVD
jgi:uncharacterized membrane protein YbhN (UPF0104 family)/membrane-associated phospholipid phosphatase